MYRISSLLLIATRPSIGLQKSSLLMPWFRKWHVLKILISWEATFQIRIFYYKETHWWTEVLEDAPEFEELQCFVRFRYLSWGALKKGLKVEMELSWIASMSLLSLNWALSINDSYCLCIALRNLPWLTVQKGFHMHSSMQLVPFDGKLCTWLLL